MNLKVLFCVLAQLNALAQFKPTDDEIVASVIILEAGGEGSMAMAAVNEVIFNRSFNRNRSKAEACLVNKQFSCVNGKTINQLVNKAKYHPRWDEALKIALVPPNIHYVGMANHFESYKALPYWAKDKNAKFIKQIGKLRFYYLEKFK